MGRMGRRFGRRPGKAAGRQGGNRRQAGLPPPIRQKLAQAMKAAKEGNHGGAAEILGGLAGKANERNRHRMAVHMALFTAGAHARGGDLDAASEWVRKAAQFGGPVQNQTVVGRRFGKLIHNLNSSGHEEAAVALEPVALEALGLSKLPAPAAGVTVNRARRRMLPKTCPTCGAGVDANAVDFDEDGADCPACGSELAG